MPISQSYLIVALLSALVLILLIGAIRSRKRRGSMLIGFFIGLVALGLVALFRPVCVPISQADAENFDPPIVERSEENFYGLRVFQQQEKGWVQCKTWIARAFFF